MRTPRVGNMESPRSNRPVANQFVISTDDADIFQSYSTVVAIRRYGANHGITLDTRALDYSVTTSKYLYQFLSNGFHGLTRADVKRAIADGTYQVADLNEGR